MPPVSPAQSRLFHGIASGSIKPRKGLPSKTVAREFVGGMDLPPKKRPAPAKPMPKKKSGK